MHGLESFNRMGGSTVKKYPKKTRKITHPYSRSRLKKILHKMRAEGNEGSPHYNKLMALLKTTPGAEVVG